MMDNKLWNGWKIEKLIGKGSFGKVYKISKEEFGDTYEAALKVIEVPNDDDVLRKIRQEGMDEKSAEAYFRSIVEDIVKEISMMSKLKGNSNIVSYEDHMVVPKDGKIGWDIYIRMELLTPLYEYLENKGVSAREVIQLGIDVCSALEICQKYNIIHRDIKPENIFVSDIGTFKVGDFGIAMQSEKAEIDLSKKGTYTYIAPEVYKGMNYDHTVDIYSLGIVMYRLMNNNRLPFMPQSQIDFSYREKANMRRLGGEKMVPPCNASEELSRIILKACAYSSQDRYGIAEEMKNDLISMLNNEMTNELTGVANVGNSKKQKVNDAIDKRLYIDSDFIEEEPTEQMFDKHENQSEEDDKAAVTNLEDKQIEVKDDVSAVIEQNNVHSKNIKDANKAKTKRWIIIIGLLALIATGVTVALFGKKGTEGENINNDVETSITVITEETVSNTEVITESRAIETTSHTQQETTVVENTTKEKKTKKVTEENTTAKKKEEKATKKKINNTVPAQKENNKIKSSKISIIRNSVISVISGGSQSKNMTNLAVYMANNRLTNADSAVDKLCDNNTLSVAAKTTTVSTYSTDEDEIINAATNATQYLSGNVSGNYGVGISSYFSGNKYHIYIVVAYEK